MNIGFIPFTLIDLVDIILVAYLLFMLYRVTKGTNTPYIIIGIIVLYIVWIIVKAMNMVLFASLIGKLISLGVLALVILFQPEIRKFLQIIGSQRAHFRIIGRLVPRKQTSIESLKPLVSACIDMSNDKTGALIVCAREDMLKSIIENGIRVDAKITSSLVKNIFFKNAPLHDGAMIISDGRITAAKCILPVTQSPVPKSYGTRHRAAIGLSEVSDAVVLVVSEETGGISIAKHGVITRDIAKKDLMRVLLEAVETK